jgi:23S rRNA pseudouridine2605 synthase
MFEHFGYEVKKLDRISFAGITTKGLIRGESRFLTDIEVKRLKA